MKVINGKHSGTDNGMFGRKHTEESKILMSKVKRKMNKIHPRPKKVRVVMNKEELSKYRHNYMKALWDNEDVRNEKLKGLREGSKKRRLFDDTVVNQLRQEYLKYRNFTDVSKLHTDITYNQIRNLIKFGTTHNLSNDNETNWLRTIQDKEDT